MTTRSFALWTGAVALTAVVAGGATLHGDQVGRVAYVREMPANAGRVIVQVASSEPLAWTIAPTDAPGSAAGAVTAKLFGFDAVAPNSTWTFASGRLDLTVLPGRNAKLVFTGAPQTTVTLRSGDTANVLEIVIAAAR